MDLQKKRTQAQAYFKKHWKNQNRENISDFGAYCVDQWLSGRNIKTNWNFLAIDFLRQFSYRNGIRGSSDIMCSTKRVKFDYEQAIGTDSAELKRFIESSLLRDKRLSKSDRMVLILYYEWGFSLKEIGDVIGVSEARTSYMLNSALERQKMRLSRDA